MKYNMSQHCDAYLPFNGWDKIIVSLHNKLIVLDENYLITKLGLEDGMLVVKISTSVEIPAVVEAMYKYIQMARIESSKTCIKCKKPGFISVKNDELMTLCKYCK